jgi:hypothetical protein
MFGFGRVSQDGKMIMIAIVLAMRICLVGPKNFRYKRTTSARNQVVSSFLRQSSTPDRDNGGTLITPTMRILVGIVGFACVSSPSSITCPNS